MLSLGIPASRAWSIAVRRRGLPSGSPPYSLAATAILRASLLNSLPRTWSTFSFFMRILCHLEWPDMPPPHCINCTTNGTSLFLDDQSGGGPASAGARGRHGDDVLHAADVPRGAEQVREVAVVGHRHAGLRHVNLHEASLHHNRKAHRGIGIGRALDHEW